MNHPEQRNEPVDHPPHYTFGNIEVIDAIEAWNLGYHLGQVVRLLVRAPHKGNFLEDLRKARWYLDRQIQFAGRWELDEQATQQMKERSA